MVSVVLTFLKLQCDMFESDFLGAKNGKKTFRLDVTSESTNNVGNVWLNLVQPSKWVEAKSEKLIIHIFFGGGLPKGRKSGTFMNL